MKTLKNQELVIAVADHGAELCSIVRNGREYLWQADPAFWARHSPVLFPIVGRVWQNKYRVDGVEYSLPQHGFARDMEFALIGETESELRYRLESSEETLAKYPYPFVLDIVYRLSGNRIEVIWEVKNPADSPMYFQIGAHPAFNYKDFDATADERGYFAFDNQKLHYVIPSPLGGVASEQYVLSLDEEGLLPINIHTFDCDTYMFEESQLKRVSLLDKAKRPYVTVEFDTPLVALWSPAKPHPDCPFVCIEPWYGRADATGYEGEFKDRGYMQCLAPGETFVGGYSMTVE